MYVSVLYRLFRIGRQYAQLCDLAVMACLYLNAVVGAFAHILNPSIQADIRDYQQYRSGERIDGMFAAVTAIGNVITLITPVCCLPCRRSTV